MNFLSLRTLICQVFLAMLIASSCSMGQSPQPSRSKPPFAEERLRVDDYFGKKVADPYRWMEAGPTDTKFLDFLKVQNDYTHAVLAPPTAPRDKPLARLKELDNAVPVAGPPTRVGENIFFLQTNPGARTASLMVRGPDE